MLSSSGQVLGAHWSEGRPLLQEGILPWAASCWSGAWICFRGPSVSPHVPLLIPSVSLGCVGSRGSRKKSKPLRQEWYLREAQCEVFLVSLDLSQFPGLDIDLLFCVFFIPGYDSPCGAKCFQMVWVEFPGEAWKGPWVSAGSGPLGSR